MKLYIFSGGTGNEYEVSLKSANNLFNSAKNIIETHLVRLDKNGEWFLNNIKIEDKKLFEEIKKEDIIFPIIHGDFGEDGKLQSILENLNLKYIASDRISMELTIDKYKTGELLQRNNIKVPRSYLVSKETDLEDIKISFPCIVKPKNEGSSVSLYKPTNKEELYDILNKELQIRDDILVQEFVIGREITCGVVEYKGRIEALLPTEVILTKGELFDYEAKYKVGGCEEITPPNNLEEKYLREIQKLSLEVFLLCGCKDIARIDTILTESGDIIVLEINTLPGITETSFIPKQLIATGYSLEEFIAGMLDKYK